MKKIEAFIRHESLEAIRDQKQAEISSKEQEIKTLQDQLQQQSLSLSAARRASMELDIQKKLISVSSPIARALIGKEEGDVVSFQAPGGEKEYEVLSVRYE